MGKLIRLFVIEVINPRLFRVLGFDELDREFWGDLSYWDIYNNMNYFFNEMKN